MINSKDGCLRWITLLSLRNNKILLTRFMFEYHNMGSFQDVIHGRR